MLVITDMQIDRNSVLLDVNVPIQVSLNGEDVAACDDGIIMADVVNVMDSQTEEILEHHEWFLPGDRVELTQDEVKDALEEAKDIYAGLWFDRE